MMSKGVGRATNDVSQRVVHKRNLSDVLEEKSCNLSSGQMSVDQKFMSPDMLALKAQRQSNGAYASEVAKKAPAFKQP